MTKIGLAIENAVAASRWRVLARSETEQTKAKFERLADIRSRAATRILSEMVGGAGHEAAHPPVAKGLHRGGSVNPSRTQTDQ